MTISNPSIRQASRPGCQIYSIEWFDITLLGCNPKNRPLIELICRAFDLGNVDDPMAIDSMIERWHNQTCEHSKHPTINSSANIGPDSDG